MDKLISITSPFYLLFLFTDEMSELLKYSTKLNNCGLDGLHGVGSALHVVIVLFIDLVLGNKEGGIEMGRPINSKKDFEITN